MKRSDQPEQVEILSLDSINASIIFLLLVIIWQYTFYSQFSC